MRALLIVLASIGSLAGCEKNKPQAKPSASRPAPDAALADPCVDQCVQDSQMKATSPEQIEADCRRQCASP